MHSVLDQWISYKQHESSIDTLLMFRIDTAILIWSKHIFKQLKVVPNGDISSWKPIDLQFVYMTSYRFTISVERSVLDQCISYNQPKYERVIETLLIMSGIDTAILRFSPDTWVSSPTNQHYSIFSTGTTRMAQLCICAHRRLRSARASALSDQSSLGFLWVHLYKGSMFLQGWILRLRSLGHSEWYNFEFAASEESDQPAHPRGLVRVFARGSMGIQGSNVSSSQTWLLSNCVYAQTDFNFRCTHMPAYTGYRLDHNIIGSNAELIMA